MTLRDLKRRAQRLLRAGGTARANNWADRQHWEQVRADNSAVTEHLRARLVALAGEGPEPPPLDPLIEARWLARLRGQPCMSRAEILDRLRRMAGEPTE